jgi:hypothetical protein
VPAQLPEPLGIAVRFSRYTPGAIDLTLDAPAPAGSALVVSENFYPGWTATVDGREAPTARVNLSLIGVELPAGARAVSLRFASRPVALGGQLSLAALLVAVAWWGVGAWRDRRHAPTRAAA